MVFLEVMGIEIPLPLPRLTWIDAMNRYGSDKPDLRFGLELKNITEMVRDIPFPVFEDALSNNGSVRAICVPDGATMTRKEIDALGEVAKTYQAKGLAWLVPSAAPRGSFLKFLSADQIEAIAEAVGADDHDLILIVSDKDSVVFSALGALRCEVAKNFSLIPENTYHLLWVTEFPLLEYSEEAGRYVAMHHPFTGPMDEDLPFLETDPGRVRAKAYDIILNGTELGGGSIRIHDLNLQKRMFSLLGFTEEQAYEQFGFLLDAFSFGVPPHGGLAFGLDRMVMLMAGCKSIRDVIAFPKVQNSSDLMTDAPASVAENQLDELGIRIMKETKDE